MTKIFVNAGHGANDCGALNKNLQLEERQITYAIGEALVNYLHNFNLETVLYQQVKSLNEVPVEANKIKADLFISIHLNANIPNKASGVEVLYCENSKEGKKFAQKILDNILEVSGYTFKNRGVKDDSNRHLAVLRRTNMNSCLVEMGFIDNDKEARFVNTHIVECAEAIGRGILSYLNKDIIKPKEEIKEEPQQEIIIKLNKDIKGKFDLVIDNKIILNANKLTTITEFLYKKCKDFIV